MHIVISAAPEGCISRAPWVKRIKMDDEDYDNIEEDYTPQEGPSRPTFFNMNVEEVDGDLLVACGVAPRRAQTGGG